MQLYCSRKKRVDGSGVDHPAPPFKYAAVADFLEKNPKLGDCRCMARAVSRAADGRGRPPSLSTELKIIAEVRQRRALEASKPQKGRMSEESRRNGGKNLWTIYKLV